MLEIDKKNGSVKDDCGIYLICNSKYFYVGQSIHISKRWKEHTSRLEKGIHENVFMQRVYDKYHTTDPFTYLKLAFCIPDDLDYFEDLYFNQVKSENPNLIAMNIAKCGASGNTEISRKHKSESSKGKPRPWKCKKVVQMDRFGNVLKIWESIKEVEKELNIKIHYSKHMCGGFQWQKYEEWLKFPKKEVKYVHNIIDTVKQFSLDGQFIKEYKNVNEVLLFYPQISRSSLISCLNGTRKTCYDFLWSYTFEAPEPQTKERHNKSKSVEQYTLKGELIATYKSINQAYKATGISPASIRNNINGNYKQAGGFLWKLQK